MTAFFDRVHRAIVSYHAQVGSLTWAVLAFPDTESWHEAVTSARCTSAGLSIEDELGLALIELRRLMTIEDYMELVKEPGVFPKIHGLPCVVDTSVQRPCVKAAAIYLPDRVPVVISI